MTEILTRRKRAIYRAEHRGTKELDLLLGQFAHAMLVGVLDGEDLLTTDTERLAIVEWLVAQPDHDLQPWLTDAGTCTNQVPDLVKAALQAYSFRVSA